MPRSAPTRFVCDQCGTATAKWFGRCPECGAWDSMTQARAAESSRAVAAAEAISWPDIPADHERRRSTGIAELDRVLGGGLVPGAAVLVGGEPGIGKSTLLLQAASRLADEGTTVLYVSGEESPTQLRSRGERVGVRSATLKVVAETDVERILETIRSHAPELVVVDSIQAVRCREIGSVPGSVTQVRESAARLVEHAKLSATPIWMVGHVTKEGSLAGPRVLEHLVDTVALFEGDRRHEHRLLRAFKNRFGPTDELGVFTMTEKGLVEVANPSELLLSQRSRGVPGASVVAAVEGTRPLLVEIQSLVGDPIQASPRRTTLGVDANRVALVLAVLQRSLGLDLGRRDVFVNVTGGVQVHEPATDLAVAAAVASSALQIPLPPNLVFAGEIGLTGEVRAISRLELRLREASRLGFDAAVVPGSSTAARAVPGIRLESARDVGEALRAGLGALEDRSADRG